MPKDKKSTEPIKVTDKRIFTSEGDLKEEYRASVNPVDPATPREEAPPPPPLEIPDSKDDKKKKLRDKATNPGTPFTVFLESLIVNAYISLGMLRSPYQTQPAIDLPAAKQMIDIVTMLSEKTAGNLTEDESDYLATHLGDLKLAYVQRGKAV